MTPSGAKTQADPLRSMLSEWWDSEKLPKIDQASPAQVDRALVEITQLEYDQRDF